MAVGFRSEEALRPTYQSGLGRASGSLNKLTASVRNCRKRRDYWETGEVFGGSQVEFSQPSDELHFWIFGTPPGNSIPCSKNHLHCHTSVSRLAGKNRLILVRRVPMKVEFTTSLHVPQIQLRGGWSLWFLVVVILIKRRGFSEGDEGDTFPGWLLKLEHNWPFGPRGCAYRRSSPARSGSAVMLRKRSKVIKRSACRLKASPTFSPIGYRCQLVGIGRAAGRKSLRQMSQIGSIGS